MRNDDCTVNESTLFGIAASVQYVKVQFALILVMSVVQRAWFCFFYTILGVSFFHCVALSLF